MSVRVLGKRVLVFQLINRRRVASGLYVGNPKRGNYSRTEEIWAITAGSDCVDEYTTGAKYFIHDGFESDPTDLDLWNDFKDDQKFDGLRTLAESCDGDIETRIVYESAILAVEDPTIIYAIDPDMQAFLAALPHHPLKNPENV